MLPNLPEIRLIKQVAGELGSKAYLVGGPLRDLLLGRPLGDIDIAVEERPRRFAREVARRLKGDFEYHAEFETATVLVPGLRKKKALAGPSGATRDAARRIDIAQTRREVYPLPAALPQVFPADIATDLCRRDFTINALACEVGTGAILDPCAGLQDLRLGIIRALHKNSFVDDPTRIFRAARFSIRLSFAVEPKTLAWLRCAIRNRLVGKLSSERILNELRLVASEPDAPAVLRLLSRWELLSQLFGVRPGRAFLSNLARLPANDQMRLLYLLGAFPKNRLDKALSRSDQAATGTIRRLAAIRTRLQRANCPSQVYRMLRHESIPGLEIVACLQTGRTAQIIRRFLEVDRHVLPQLRGDDLKALGIPPGPAYTRLLLRLRMARLDHPQLTRQDEVQLIRRYAGTRALPQGARQ